MMALLENTWKGWGPEILLGVGQESAGELVEEVAGEAFVESAL
jgi:hypothetical protein